MSVSLRGGFGGLREARASAPIHRVFVYKLCLFGDGSVVLHSTHQCFDGDGEVDLAGGV